MPRAPRNLKNIRREIWVLRAVEEEPGTYPNRIAKKLKMRQNIVESTLRRLERDMAVYATEATGIDGRVVHRYYSQHMAATRRFTCRRRGT